MLESHASKSRSLCCGPSGSSRKPGPSNRSGTSKDTGTNGSVTVRTAMRARLERSRNPENASRSRQLGRRFGRLEGSRPSATEDQIRNGSGRHGGDGTPHHNRTAHRFWRPATKIALREEDDHSSKDPANRHLNRRRASLIVVGRFHISSLVDPTSMVARSSSRYPREPDTGPSGPPRRTRAVRKSRRVTKHPGSEPAARPR